MDRSTIEQMIKNRTGYSCPIAGCSKGKKTPCMWDQWVEDEDMKLKLESWKRRESRRKAREEEEEEEEDSDESEGEDVEVL